MGIIATLVALAAIRSFAFGPADFASRYDWKTQLRGELMRMCRDPNYAGDERLLTSTFPPFLDMARNELPFLKEHGLSLCADAPHGLAPMPNDSGKRRGGRDL